MRRITKFHRKVIYQYTTDETTEFFKNVAFNRGVSIAFFNDKKKALAWLGFQDNE